MWCALFTCLTVNARALAPTARTHAPSPLLTVHTASPRNARADAVYLAFTACKTGRAPQARMHLLLVPPAAADDTRGLLREGHGLMHAWATWAKGQPAWRLPWVATGAVEAV